MSHNSDPPGVFDPAAFAEAALERASAMLVAGGGAPEGASLAPRARAIAAEIELEAACDQLKAAAHLGVPEAEAQWERIIRAKPGLITQMDRSATDPAAEPPWEEG